MKNIKRLVLGFVAVFAAVLLVGCGAKSDNGTYKMETNINQLLGQDSESEVLKGNSHSYRSCSVYAG